MKNNHVTEDEIQAFLDGTSPERAEQIRRHIAGCPVCRAQEAAYKSLYRDLAVAPELDLPANFASRIADAASVKNASALFSPVLDIVIIAAAVISTFLAIIFFVDIKALTDTMSRIALPKFTLNGNFMDPLKQLLAGLNGSLSLLPFAGLALLLTFAADRFIAKTRRNRASA